ncbi:MAG TPA: RHS repeat-associated core domain-containing protein [Bacteriovoracaceae bacterium]|nr:RHS repeat-associated core domain-containing protein [Bacteriovoracaceae bacterium]
MRDSHYDPGVGRFLSEDPHPGKLGSPITVTNKYIYAVNNPIRYADPEGKFIIEAMIIGAIVGGLMAHYSGQNILEGMLIGAVAGVAGGWVGGVAFSAAGGGIAGGVVGAFSGVVVGGLAGGFTAGLINYGGGGFSESFNRGFGIGAVAGGITGGTLGYFGSWGSAYATAENYALGIVKDPIGYALENPSSTIVPAVGIIGSLACKGEKVSEPFSNSFSCSL